MSRRKQAEEVIRYIESLKDDAGRACIDLRLSGSTELYNPLSFGADRDISDAIYQFIDRHARIVPDNIPLHLRIHSDDVQQKELSDIRDIIRRHYSIQTYDATVERAWSQNKLVAMLLLGCVTLMLSIWLTITVHAGAITEILSIVASFALCEAASTLFLERPQLKKTYSDIEQSRNMTIELIADENNSQNK